MLGRARNRCPVAVARSRFKSDARCVCVWHNIVSPAKGRFRMLMMFALRWVLQLTKLIERVYLWSGLKVAKRPLP